MANVCQPTLEEFSQMMRERKPIHTERHRLRRKKALKRHAQRRKDTINNNQAYRKKRIADLVYYLDRSDLTVNQLSKSLGIYYGWFTLMRVDAFEELNEHRITTIIEFVKDYEKLQSYYAAVIKQ